jgi:hypothetical protein
VVAPTSTPRRPSTTSLTKPRLPGPCTNPREVADAPRRAAQRRTPSGRRPASCGPCRCDLLRPLVGGVQGDLSSAALVWPARPRALHRQYPVGSLDPVTSVPKRRRPEPPPARSRRRRVLPATLARRLRRSPPRWSSTRLRRAPGMGGRTGTDPVATTTPRRADTTSSPTRVRPDPSIIAEPRRNRPPAFSKPATATASSRPSVASAGITGLTRAYLRAYARTRQVDQLQLIAAAFSLSSLTWIVTRRAMDPRRWPACHHRGRPLLHPQNDGWVRSISGGRGSTTAKSCEASPPTNHSVRGI